MKATEKVFTVGLPMPISFAVGSAINNNVVIGAGVDFSYRSDAVAAGTTSNIAMGLRPFFQYVFDGQGARPFAGAHIDVAYGTNDQGATTGHKFGIGGGLDGGVHIFLADAFSVDPQLSVNMVYLSSSQTISSVSVSGSGYGLNLQGGVGFTGWF